MKYMGSKNRIAKYILPIILKDRKEGQWYVEPFCGGCNSIDKVGGTGFAVTHIPITLLEMCVREAEAEIEEKYITLFGDGKD